MKNPNLVKAFKTAKRRIKQNSAVYICHALDNVREYGAIDRSAPNAAKKLVQSRIHPYYSLEAWLEGEHQITRVSSRPYWAKIKATRIAWLNSLIKEFS